MLVLGEDRQYYNIVTQQTETLILDEGYEDGFGNCFLS